MQPYIWKRWKTGSLFSFYTKCGAIFLLIALSVLVVACGGDANTNTASLGGPSTTLTIQIGNNNNSPTPALPGYWCGVWVTNTTPQYDSTKEISVYGKFTQNVDGNPAGIGGATATVQVIWSSADIETYTTTTTGDGLAVFTIPITNKTFALYTVTLVTVTFQKAGVPDCTVGQDRAAFFTLMQVTATASPTASKTPGRHHNGQPGG